MGIIQFHMFWIWLYLPTPSVREYNNQLGKSFHFLKLVDVMCTLHVIHTYPHWHMNKWPIFVLFAYNSKRIGHLYSHRNRTLASSPQGWPPESRYYHWGEKDREAPFFLFFIADNASSCPLHNPSHLLWEVSLI